MKMTLNDTECQVINLDTDGEQLSELCDITKEELDELNIKFLVKLSLVPKFEQDQIKY